MNIQEQLHVAKAARKMLETCWVPNVLTDGGDGHCHVGALGKCAYDNAFRGFNAYELLKRLDNTSERMYPTFIPRSNTHFSVGVNNELGKDCILAVYDDVIAQLEVALLCEQEETIAELEFAK
jgi:hypothetical protein